MPIIFRHCRSRSTFEPREGRLVASGAEILGEQHEPMTFDASAPYKNRRLISQRLGLLLTTAGALALFACGGLGQYSPDSAPGGSGEDAAVGGGGSGPDASGEASSGEAAGETGDSEISLLGSPLPFAPTVHGFALNAIVNQGDPSLLRAHVRAQGTTTWGALVVPENPAADIAQWDFEGLGPGVRYQYEILAPLPGGDTPIYTGSVVTQRLAGDSFAFALITDSHIGSDLNFSNQGTPSTLKTISAEVGSAAPDFMVNLGDMLDFHEYGFNDPPPDGSITRLAYLNYRTLLGDTLGHTTHYATIGNWEGENGCYTADEIARSMQERLLYVPGPNPTTYPEGGSPNQDYYAFTWGDALFIVLNVMSYTPTPHLLSYDPGVPDDWTLGDAQFSWFENTLTNATSKWRFVFIHHTVGGAAGDDADSAYGRGGGQAAYVGEQAKVHQLMLEYGVQIFFYGHDHVFTDMQVDGIHYTLPGSAGAPWMFSQSQTGYAQSWLESGWARVTVRPAAVNVQFLQMGGGVLYQYTLE